MGVPVRVRPRLPNNMFAFITLGTNNLSVSSVFYDNLLRPLGIIKAVNEDRYIGYAKKKY